MSSPVRHSLRALSQDPRCMPDKKPAPQAESPEQIGPFHRNIRGVFQSAICAVPQGR